MKKYNSTDLTTFSPARARQFGSAGVPAELIPIAKEFPVKSVALVKSYVDVCRAIRQGYSVPVCSQQGFQMQRDKDGFCRASGVWPHCMLFCGVRGGARPGVFCCNNWGPNAHTGPVFPEDMPVEGFWVEPSVVDRMCSQGDTFAVSDIEGFPARKLNWFIMGQPFGGQLVTQIERKNDQLNYVRRPVADLNKDWLDVFQKGPTLTVAVKH